VTGESFTSLNKSIIAFTATFKTFAVGQKAGDQAMIDQVNGQIADLQGQINRYIVFHVFVLHRLTSFSYDAAMVAFGILIGASPVATVGALSAFPQFAALIVVRVPSLISMHYAPKV
jgi:hypothetical protein